MNVLRGDTGGSEQTRKGNLCHLVLHLCFSVPAVHSHRFHSSQHNEPETSKQGPRGRERERRREGDKSGKKRLKEERQTPKYLFFCGNAWRHYRGIFPAALPCLCTEWTSTFSVGHELF